MPFISPIPFRQALEVLRKKVLLPTSASSAQLADLPAQIHQLAELSARTTNADHLQRILDLTDQLLSGGRHDPESGAYIPGSYMDPATMRLKLKESLKEISYDPYAEPGVAGTIKDLSSDPRINLIIRMQSEMALGLGKFIQSQDPAALDAAPAQELFRLEARKKTRDWPAIWDTAGGEFYGDGRMIALKNDPIWVAISDFDLPYPPFKYGSGMWTRDILRPEAEALGVMDPGEPAPDPAEIPSLPKVSSISDLSEDLRAALLSSMPGAEFIDGVLRLP
ncbi:MAG: hypothetical protein PHW60_01145 [Kiritimatiellae bacterium]|nr:hypothetical protein [Kiritimatiellia bacterium]